MSFIGYGSTGHHSNDSKQQSAEDVRVLTVSSSAATSSSSTLRGRDEYNHGPSQDNMISADGSVPSVAGVRNRNSTGSGIDEKSTLLNNQQYGQNQTEGHQHSDKDDHHHHLGCFHAPGEHCSLPHIIQPLVSPLHHAVMENVVIKVRDSADVTQKTIFYFWDEWKLFVNRGNVIDLGIGVVIGGAFSDIIDSIVADILTPPLSLWAAGTNLENSFFVLRHGRTPGKVYATYQEAQADGAVTENTGQFLKACLNFLVIAFFLFWIVKAVHKIRQEKIKPPPKEKMCNWCRESIHLEAFRCKYCQSFVKDIPGIEDAGVGMFVAIKKPKAPQHTASSQSQPAEHAVANDIALLAHSNSTASSTSLPSTPNCASGATPTIGPKDGKKIAAELAKMENV
ncbi:hypothetical protein BGX27_001495 [Mortierella sp. AM989]|nr:hypothetical protein BGX27_001495 [Mortierella sp. AM989]